MRDGNGDERGGHSEKVLPDGVTDVLWDMTAARRGQLRRNCVTLLIAQRARLCSPSASLRGLETAASDCMQLAMSLTR